MSFDVHNVSFNFTSWKIQDSTGFIICRSVHNNTKSIIIVKTATEKEDENNAKYYDSISRSTSCKFVSETALACFCNCEESLDH